MRILLATAAASFAFTATPVFAQHGGSPAEQVDGAPGEPDAAQPDEAGSGPEGENNFVDVPSYENADEVEIAGKDQAGEDYALADVDADLDVGAEVDADMDAGALPPAPEVEYDEAGEAADEAYEAGPDGQGEAWQGEDGQAYCRRSDGTTGLVVGGGAGALVGREIGRDGRGYRRRGRGGGGTTGAIIGGLIGAVVGSAVERSASEQGCR
jgi:hypothetical protein